MENIKTVVNSMLERFSSLSVSYDLSDPKKSDYIIRRKGVVLGNETIESTFSKKVNITFLPWFGYTMKMNSTFISSVKSSNDYDQFMQFIKTNKSYVDVIYTLDFSKFNGLFNRVIKMIGNDTRVFMKVYSRGGLEDVSSDLWGMLRLSQLL